MLYVQWGGSDCSQDPEETPGTRVRGGSSVQSLHWFQGSGGSPESEGELNCSPTSNFWFRVGIGGSTGLPLLRVKVGKTCHLQPYIDFIENAIKRQCLPKQSYNCQFCRQGINLSWKFLLLNTACCAVILCMKITWSTLIITFHTYCLKYKIELNVLKIIF